MFINAPRMIKELSNMGVLEIGEFILRYHQNTPEAPKSCFKINLRSIDSGGPLTQANIETIGGWMHRWLVERESFSPDWVTGIPHTGEVFARIISQREKIPLLHLIKEESGGERKISHVEGEGFRPGQKVLIVDDVLNRGYSSRESIDAIEQVGLKIADLFFVVNREQVDKSLLEWWAHRTRINSLFTVKGIVNWQKKNNFLSGEQASNIISEIRASK